MLLHPLCTARGVSYITGIISNLIKSFCGAFYKKRLPEGPPEAFFYLFVFFFSGTLYKH